MRPQLNTRDLVAALTTFGDRYDAVDVFADDLSDSAAADVAKCRFSEGGRAFEFSVLADRGVVRLTRLSGGDSGGTLLAGAALGGLAGAIASAEKQRGEGIVGGALLGLLVGGLLSASGTPVRKVFAMEFDPINRTWVAYDGTLLRWMKNRLLPPPATG